MDLCLRNVLVLFGLLVIAEVCSGRGRCCIHYRRYRSYNSYGSSGYFNTSGGGFIAGMVVLGVGVAVVIIILTICLLRKKGIICSSPTVTTNLSPTVVTLNPLFNVKGFDPTDNYTMGFVNPPPPPTYFDVYPPPQYSNGNVSAPDPAFPPSATGFQ